MASPKLLDTDCVPARAIDACSLRRFATPYGRIGEEVIPPDAHGRLLACAVSPPGRDLPRSSYDRRFAKDVL